MQLQRKLISGLFWILLLNLLIKPFWILGIEVGVQNAVSTSEYGIYITLFNLAYIFNILLDLGITNFNTRNIARHPALINRYCNRLLAVKAILLVFYMLVTMSAGLLNGYGSRQFQLLALLCFNQFLNSLILFLRSNLEGLLLFRWDSVVSVLDRIVMIVICGFLLWGPPAGSAGGFSIFWFVYAQTAAYLVTALVALVVVMRKLHRNRNLASPSRFTFSKRNLLFALAILKRSAPFALLVLLMASYNRIDPLLLSLLLPEGDHAAGIYAGAFRLLDALSMIPYLVSVPLLPVFARLTHQNDHPQLSSTTLMVTSLLLVFSLTAAFSCSALGTQLMDVLYTEHVAEYASVFTLLVFCIIPISITYVFGTLLTAAGHLRQLNILATITLVINIVVNLICIPRLGVIGAACASLTAQSFMAIAQMIVALRLFHMRPPTSYLLRLGAFILLVGAIAFGTRSFVWWQSMLIAAGVALALADLLGILKTDILTQLLKSTSNVKS
jgi:O-antigen/teichoic acid export membrane protein